MLLGYFRRDIFFSFNSRIINTLNMFLFISFILQVLVDKGVLIDEMKLYGQTEIDEAIDESLSEFSDLEAVISKVLMLIWFDTYLVLSLSLCLYKSNLVILYECVCVCVYLYINKSSYVVWKTN